jgi:5-methylcytosine-specific restriction protein A
MEASLSWYSTPAWRQIRRGQLSREPLCRHCTSRGQVTAAVEVDHINGFTDWDSFCSGPFQCLCVSCHARKTRRDHTGKRHIGTDVDGRPVDPSHPWNRGKI